MRGPRAPRSSARRGIRSHLGLGGSIGTPADGIRGRGRGRQQLEDLRSHSAEIKGRIVLFNAPFTTYGDTVTYRTGGARAASQLGAVATLVRGVGPTGLRTAHTGSLQYGQGVAPIPAASVTAEDADRIARLRSRNIPVRVRLMMEARTETDVESANVVGELRGRERPHEIVLLGGHLDSWDVGTGASDDGVGCVITWSGPADGEARDPAAAHGQDRALDQRGERLRGANATR